MKIGSVVPENGCLKFFADGKKTKINKKTSVKHVRYRLIGGCVNKGWKMQRQTDRLTHIFRPSEAPLDRRHCKII